METDWSVECAAEDPAVVVPWASEDKSICYIDLHDAPARVNEIPEAAQYPCLAAALRRWNQRDAPLFTAKCDVWNYASNLFDAEDLGGFDYAQGSYIDLLAKDPVIFSSFAVCEQLLKAWNDAARSISLPTGRCEWVLRPARILPVGNEMDCKGFATTVYVWGYGLSPQAATDAWATALEALIEPVVLLERLRFTKL